MKNIFYLLIIAAMGVSFGACNNNNGNVDEAWKTANTNAYDSIKKLPDFHALETTTGPTGVYYKIIQSGTPGTEYPLQTSTVSVLYSGAYYNKTVFDVGTSQNNIPKKFSLTSVVRGFSFALQNMVVGDKWEIWIPYYLGYGATGKTDSYGNVLMKGYTTLVFTVELVSINQYPAPSN
jgi:FKBP-type peptidyl-prolyl cis-trans isomerase